jgi:hypothetical protein
LTPYSGSRTIGVDSIGGNIEMRKSESILRSRNLRLGAAFSAALFALSAAGLSAAGNAAATSVPAPTGISASASTDNSSLGGAVPAVLAVPGDPITLTVTLTPAGAEFNTATPLTLAVSLAGGGNPHGTLTPTSITMPANANSATFTIAYSAIDNGVQVTVAVAKVKGKTSLVTPGTTLPFDILKVVNRFGPDDPNLITGLGVGNANCTQESTESECGTLVLSHGFSSASGALSLGACTSDLGCTTGSQVVQFIADLGTRYTPTDPAVLTIRCSKQQCPGKSSNGYTVKLSFSPTGPLSLVSAPCVSKGVALDAAGNEFCTDYTQSHRDNAGDTLLLVLFTHDMRGST